MVPLDDALPDEHVYAVRICVQEHPVQTREPALTLRAPALEECCGATSKEIVPSFSWFGEIANYLAADLEPSIDP
ncbi:unnamed protein product [Arabis nemorensis]|uniref:Uncharacterized protein n=1 Tax=Arabis nemorensis TaxID=586526 RepID=A0A565BAM8_9BRAS|nr:unnamed protein product [Arabis nemorensis]